MIEKENEPSEFDIHVLSCWLFSRLLKFRQAVESPSMAFYSYLKVSWLELAGSKQEPR